MIPELIVLFASMVPFLDLKLSIPLGRQLGLSSASTFLFATSGAIIPAAIGLALIGPVAEFARKHSPFMNKFITNLFKQTRKSHSKNFNRYGALIIISLIAIPIPGTGSLTGAMVAFIFGVDYWKALSMVCLGVVCSAILLLAGFESIFAILDIFT